MPEFEKNCLAEYQENKKLFDWEKDDKLIGMITKIVIIFYINNKTPYKGDIKQSKFFQLFI